MIENPACLVVAGIAPQALREMELSSGPIAKPGFDATEVIFCAIPVFFVRTLADELKEHVRSRLARHKVPREIEFVEELPRTQTGKLKRRELVSDPS